MARTLTRPGSKRSASRGIAADATRAEVELETPPSHDDADFQPSPAGWAARGSVLAFVGVLVLWLGPVVLLNGEEWFALSLAAVYAIIGLSLNVLIGYTGTISLGHQAFVGIGAFASAYVVTELEQPFLIGVAVAGVIGVIQAMLLGGLALRVTGLYFALITLSYGLFAQDTLFGIQSITGGGSGREAPLPTGPDNFAPYYFICLAFLAAVLFIDWRLMQTKGGRALLALRENPRVASTFGINVRAYTVLGFGVAGPVRRRRRCASRSLERFRRLHRVQLLNCVGLRSHDGGRGFAQPHRDCHRVGVLRSSRPAHPQGSRTRLPA